MKMVTAVVLGMLLGLHGYVLYELVQVRNDLKQQQTLERERYLFFTDMHIYSFQVRESFDLFTKLTYARLLKLEGTLNMDSSIKDLNTRYEQAATLTETEWHMLKSKHPEQIREFALKYEVWLKDREMQPGH